MEEAILWIKGSAHCDGFATFWPTSTIRRLLCLAIDCDSLGIKHTRYITYHNILEWSWQHWRHRILDALVNLLWRQTNLGAGQLVRPWIRQYLYPIVAMLNLSQFDPNRRLEKLKWVISSPWRPILFSCLILGLNETLTLLSFLLILCSLPCKHGQTELGRHEFGYLDFILTSACSRLRCWSRDSLLQSFLESRLPPVC